MRWNCIGGIGHISQSVNLEQPVGVYFGCELPIARPRGQSKWLSTIATGLTTLRLKAVDGTKASLLAV